LILILCLVQFQAKAFDWFSRTIRVDLIVDRNHRAFNSQYDILERSDVLSNGVDAIIGQFPWSFMSTALSVSGSATRCSGTIIKKDFALSDFQCVGQHLDPPANSIEVVLGSVRFALLPVPTNFVRHFWYIEPTSENQPNIVLFRMHETIEFNPSVQPMRMPFYVDYRYEGWSSLILGFQLKFNNYEYLQSVNVSILSNSLCTFEGRRIADHDICCIDSTEPSSGVPAIRSGGAWIVYEYTNGGYGGYLVPMMIGIHRDQFRNHNVSYSRATKVADFSEWIYILACDDSPTGCF